MKFVSWATSKSYVRLAASVEGWVAAPPGTRQSTYNAVEYQHAAPFATFVLNAINTAIPANPGTAPHDDGGAQFVAIPEYQGIGTQVGQMIASTLTGNSSVDAALKAAQSATERTMRQAGYLN